MGDLERGLALLVSHLPPCILFEDDHLLVVNKPAGLNTHAPSPYAGEGIYDWLRHREPRWSSLAMVHRLDKETSGVMILGKTSTANRSLTEQFASRSVRKRYLLLTDRPLPSEALTVRSALIRLGERYASRPDSQAPIAETRFRFTERRPSGHSLVQAEPITGKTHQIRVHAAENGFPILGDVLYGGPASHRVCLHATLLTIQHPVTGQEITFTADPDFELDARLALREALIEPALTDSYRLVHGGADHWPGWYLDRLGSFLLSASEGENLVETAADHLRFYLQRYQLEGACHKHLSRQPGRTDARASPKAILGSPAPGEVIIRENGLRFSLRFGEGYSVGLFLDQRDNRRRVLTQHVAAEFPLGANRPLRPAEVLNTFAYTCAFSVCAAKAGMRTTSLDLSRKYLQWGQRNFHLNGLDPSAHDFIYGDALDWMGRLARKRRSFDLVILDPPTFSRSKNHGTFQVEKDYPRLVQASLPLLKPGAVLLACTNAATLRPEAFLELLQTAVGPGRRRIVHQHYFPQPPDFPVSREEPAYLKTVWMRLA